MSATLWHHPAHEAESNLEASALRKIRGAIAAGRSRVNLDSEVCAIIEPADPTGWRPITLRLR